MVENFTQHEETYDGVIEKITKDVEESFQVKIKESLQDLAKEPRQSSIDKILNYSKSFDKK